jgi:hypothetical protein
MKATPSGDDAVSMELMTAARCGERKWRAKPYVPIDPNHQNTISVMWREIDGEISRDIKVFIK